jgi:hypothetical protein
VTPDERLEIAALQPTTSERLRWPGLRAEHLTDPPGRELDLPGTTYHWLIFNQRSSPTLSLQLEGQERIGRGARGPLTLIPAGCASRWRWRWSGPSESTHILLEPQLLARVAAEPLDLNPDRVILPLS